MMIMPTHALTWAIVLLHCGSSFALEPFPEFAAVDQATYYANTDALWLRAGGTREIIDFTNSLPVLNMLNDQSFVLTYRPLGAVRSLCRISNYTRDCATPYSAVPGTDVDHPTNMAWSFGTYASILPFFSKVSDFTMYPILGSAVAVVHDIPGLTAPLVLTRNLLGRIFRQCDPANNASCQPNDIKQWADPDILALNPGQSAALTAAGDIRVVVRGDTAASTLGLRDTLIVADPYFAEQMGTISLQTATWPSVLATKVYGTRARTHTHTHTYKAHRYAQNQKLTTLLANRHRGHCADAVATRSATGWFARH